MENLLKPYRVIREDESTITYEYNTLYTWALYSILVVIGFGIFIENQQVEYAGFSLVVVYFLCKLLVGKEESQKVKAAIKTNFVELKGKKHSFSSPLQIKVQRIV